MDLIFNFPAFTVLISLLCSGIGFAVKNPAKARALSLSLLLSCLVMNILTLLYCLRNGPFTYMMGHYPAPWGNELYAGICESLMAAAFSLVTVLALIGGGKELKRDIPEDKLSLYYVMVSLTNASLSALVYTNDIFTAYVFIEICTIASTGLLMIRNNGRTILAATRYMIFSLLGSGLFLIGVILLYGITGHLLMPGIMQACAALPASGEYHLPFLIVIGLITIGIGIKSGMFPFHYWMPDTYGSATAASSGILSGIISKGYIFLLIKIIYRCIGVEVFYASGINNILFAFGVCGMIFGSVQAISQNDINRMTAFSSAAQIGYIYMGIGLSPTLGLWAAVFHILAHALTKPLLFLSISKLSLVSGGSRHFHQLRGSAGRNKMAGFAFAMGSLSMVGMPMFMGFVSKLLFAQAAVQGRLKMLITLLALAISTILNTMYFLRTLITVCSEKSFGGDRDSTMSLSEQKGFAFAAVCFILVNILIGLHSQPIVSLIRQGLI